MMLTSFLVNPCKGAPVVLGIFEYYFPVSGRKMCNGLTRDILSSWQDSLLVLFPVFNGLILPARHQLELHPL
jgi:hypothetical protein